MTPGDSQSIDPLARSSGLTEAPASLRERLVAYLDGELPAAEAERVESRLTSDPQWEAELLGLDRAWHALDALPRSTVSPAFARTTVAMVAEAAESDLVAATTALPIRKRRSRVLGFALAVGAATAGFLLAFALGAADNRRLLEDLPLIQHSDTLEQAQSVEFVRLLVSDERAFKVLESLAAADVAAEAAEWGEVAAMRPLPRRDHVVALEPERKEQLSQRVAAFEALTRPQQEQLRKTHKELIADAKSYELRRAAIAYATFVGTLTAGERANLRGLTPADRVESVRKTFARRVGDLRIELTADERKRFREAIDSISKSDGVRVLIDSLEERGPFGEFGGPGGPPPPPGPPGDRREGQRQRPIDRLREAPERIAAFARERPELVLLRAAEVASRGDQRWPAGEALRTAWPAWERALLKGAPERVQRLHAAADDFRTQSRLMHGLIADAVFGEGAPNPPRDFAELSRDKQAALLAMPLDEMQRELAGERLEARGAPPWLRRFPGEFDGPPPRGGPFGPHRPRGEGGPMGPRGMGPPRPGQGPLPR
ncbi:MAG: anti-sigma factor family protein [Lacipirellulaceae bacterium]